MSAAEVNRALRTAQRLLKAEADRLPQVENGYNNYGPHPNVSGLLRGVGLIEALIEPDQED